MRRLVAATILLMPAASGEFPMPAQDQGQKVTWEEYWKVDQRIQFGWKDAPIESIVLAGKRQLFVDNVVIEHSSNLTRKLHQPRRHELNPLLTADQPWEIAVTYCNVIRDPPDGGFKAWYQTPNGLGYATSDDGIHWKKPTLGLVDYKGSKANNLVLPSYGTDSPTILHDPYDANPRRRYKYFAKHNEPTFGMYVGYSPDGIQWEIRPQPVLTSANDPGLNDRPNLVQDVERRRFIALTKREMINPFGRGDWGMMQRCRAVSISQDFERWSDPVLTLHPDDQDPPDLQIYGLVGFNYESLYLGLMDMFWSRPVGSEERTVDVQMALSRDGETWWRAGDRKTFLPIGPDGSWDRFRVYPANTPPIRMGEELWIYYRGTGESRHGEAPPPHRRIEPWLEPGHSADIPLARGIAGTGMGVARLRRDGFVSLDAGPRPGQMLTKPLFFDGESFHVNVDASQGWIRAALYQAEKIPNRSPTWNWSIRDPIPGFTFEDCSRITADRTDAVLRWKGGSLKPFSGKPVVVKFELAQSALYAFWVQ